MVSVREISRKNVDLCSELDAYSINLWNQKQWISENTTEEWKSENLKKIKSRMQGWQLSTFEESYKHKINQGISLFKKNLLES